jgi:hypothetical protein
MWEYKWAWIKFAYDKDYAVVMRDEALAQFGREGWEAVGVAMPGAGGNDVVVLLKRRVD